MPTPTYHLFVDDSGSRDINAVTIPRKDGMDYFALGGVLIAAEDSQRITSEIQQFRAKHNITAPLHSTKIRSRQKAWAWLGSSSERERADRFYADLSQLMCGIAGYVTGCVVHRPGYTKRYGHYGDKKWHLAKTAYPILVERAAKIAMRDSRKLAIFLEQTGKKEDRAIKDYHTEIIQKGLSFNSSTSSQYNPLTCQSFSNVLLKEPNFFTKDNLIGQLADLALYPIIKGRYDPSYPPYIKLLENKKIIDCHLMEEEKHCGIKYSCFDGL
ncbi:DUF3800 domain-containing protein [Acetobacter orientalis]|uniref:DUF3800 domain-containing protein n=1 Tax=Acetobacter orientalis TaxID=146474 RepID=UPI00209F311C|nr:DUF3800 domain-containing protein [Acetobacter orientalis]MCP1214614.1 DUF3800 domain-containing protein [Acetobacter orientalis]MCP1218196.1 DUF3800 domain-containing protein [Acetobacter orientalis]